MSTFFTNRELTLPVPTTRFGKYVLRGDRHKREHCISIDIFEAIQRKDGRGSERSPFVIMTDSITFAHIIKFFCEFDPSTVHRKVDIIADIGEVFDKLFLGWLDTYVTAYPTPPQLEKKCEKFTPNARNVTFRVQKILNLVKVCEIIGYTALGETLHAYLACLFKTLNFPDLDSISKNVKLP